MKLLPHLVLGLLLIHPAGAVDYLLVAQPNTNSIRRFNGTTGAPKGDFIAPQIGGLSSPRGMVVGPDGDLYVADAVASRVKRFSLVDGSPVGDGNFTPVDLSFPVALKFAADGNLSVLGGSAQREIRRYNGTSGGYISTAVSGSIRINAGTDFLSMQGNGDWLVISGLNRGARFAASGGAFISFLLNSAGSLDVMNQLRSIVVGPDGNYWVTNRGSNRITRYDAATGAKLNDVVDGAPLNGPAGLVISGDQLFVSNSYGNNLLRYTITNAATGTVSAATEVIPASAGLNAPEHILKVFIEDAPTAQAGADFSIPGGEPFTLDGGTSSDPKA